MDSDEEDAPSPLLERRQQLTEQLYESPYDLVLYLERATVHADLGYPDLAAGDSYRALLLCDEVRDESGEYHEEALEALTVQSTNGLPEILRKYGMDKVDLAAKLEDLRVEDNAERVILGIALKASVRCYQTLALSLLLCGCLKSAYDFCKRGLDMAPKDQDLAQFREYILNMGRKRLKLENMDVADLPDQGLVRREMYPWNNFEPNRYSGETLAFLNAELASVAPKCEVRVTELPTLWDTASTPAEDGVIRTNKQLGLFAKEDILPGEIMLKEISLLTANNRLKENLCDACSSELPPLTVDSAVVGCPECDDTMFCDEACLSRAQESYHPAVCDKDIDTISKDPIAKESPNALYQLLLVRALAMSSTLECHPLELKEVKYIWGDFLPSASNAVPISLNAGPPPVWTLPFSFNCNIALPLHVLEKMDVDIYATLSSHDLWIFNTLYAKFRGTASARVSLRDGRPEVAAVHPLWCLANHDCDPNVQWEWGGLMQFWSREKRICGEEGGVKKGEEIFNHYCDIELGVEDRREWASGSLGGWCMCRRCRIEAGELGDDGMHGVGRT